MLSISVFLDKDNKITAFEAEGHMELAPRGCDIACAGASAIILTAVFGLTKTLKIMSGIEIEEGYLYITLPDDLDNDTYEKAQAILTTALYGLEEVDKNFPGRIELRFEQLDSGEVSTEKQKYM